MITCDIIATGSTGNAVLINGEILIDCGVPHKKLEPYRKSLKLVLLTHQHRDHFRPATVRALHQERPTLRWGCCEWMVGLLLEAGVDKRSIDVLEPHEPGRYRNLAIVRPEPLIHNVPNCGYHIFCEHESLFYATDCATLDGIEAKSYTLYAVEANHGEDEIAARIEAKRAAREYAYEIEAARNHLSEEQALKWLALNAGPNSRYVFLHQHKERKRRGKEQTGAEVYVC